MTASASSRLSSAARTPGVAFASALRPEAISVRDFARASVLDCTRLISLAVSIRAAMSAKVERSMPVISTSLLWLTPSSTAIAERTENWRSVMPASRRASADLFAASCWARCSKWLADVPRLKFVFDIVIPIHFVPAGWAVSIIPYRTFHPSASLCYMSYAVYPIASLTESFRETPFFSKKRLQKTAFRQV